jgi:poly-gamma-glutamate capsule biosynthesis protein CapA/YwtB (metallophosphatase superfamily)
MRLILLGDVMLGRLVNRVLKTAPPEYPWGDVLPVLRSADALVPNLECVISDLGEPWPGKTFVFRSDRKNVEVLERARVTALSLANNHALDMGDEALGECLAILAERGILAAGAGTSLELARKPAVFPIGAGTRAALVAFTDNEPDWEATEATAGLFHSPVDPADIRFQVLLDIVRAMADHVDLVIVSAHWGPNWGEEPPASHLRAARLLVKAGADVVFGHSAHVFRGVEVYRGHPVLYSCGDFVDDYAVDEVERNDWSFVFALDFDGVVFRRLLLIPTIIRNLQARLARGYERREIIDKMRTLCLRLGTGGVREVGEGLEIAPPPVEQLSAP